MAELSTRPWPTGPGIPTRDEALAWAFEQVARGKYTSLSRGGPLEARLLAAAHCYPGQYVAAVEGRVLAHAPTATAVLETLLPMGLAHYAERPGWGCYLRRNDDVALILVPAATPR